MCVAMLPTSTHPISERRNSNMHIYSIYKAVNTNNDKCYIGFDSNWPKRVKTHKQRVNEGSNCYFHNAIRKYGWESFQWEVLYQSLDKNHCLNEMESYFIQFYDSKNNGYNMTFGGEGSFGRTFTPETRMLMSKRKKGQRAHPEQIRLVSKTYNFIDPNGQFITITNLNKFCR